MTGDPRTGPTGAADAGVAPVTSFQLLPAVDVAEGRASQVVDGGTDDPAEVAARWVAEGAPWIHLVDLDRAHRRGEQTALLGRLVADLRVPVQLSGGLDTPAAVDAALATGAARVNLAVTALTDPGWVADLVARHGPRIAVGLDIRDDEVVARGSGEHLGTLGSVLRTLREHLDGPARPGAYVVADAGRDGRRSGADLALFRRVAAYLDAPVIASGGVAGVEDLRGLRGCGVAGVVLGSALYHRDLTLEQALEACR